MTRPERRRQMKAIEKELEYIDKHTHFRNMSTYFSGLDDESLILLSEGKHINEKTQADFKVFKGLLNRVVDLNHKYASLKKPINSP